MTEKEARAESPFAMRLLTATVTICLLVLMWLGFGTYQAYLVARQTQERDFRIEELRGKIVHLDEILTMSARMAATTGDLKWEVRYRRHEPELTKLIEEAIKLAPGAYEGAAAGKTDAANEALVAMENEAFKLVREGKRDEAHALLSGELYASHKKTYAQGMATFGAALAEASKGALKQQQRRTSMDIVFVLVAVPMLVIGCVVALRTMHMRHRELAEAKEGLERQAAELSELNTNLDQKVEDRTRDLEEATAREVEQRQKLAKALEAADAANLAKSVFLSNMSHELRTPLNGVLGYVQVLQRDRTLDDQQRHSLDSIRNCGQHLLDLINDVLDISKIEAGRMELETAPCDFARLVNSVADMIRPRGEEKGLELVLDVEPRVPRGIMTDEKKLRQVLVNLLCNAVKFTEKGHVGLSVSESDGKTLSMKVSDTGIGISEEHKESIFDPFAQSEGGKAEGGTGLGLAISLRIVEAMGGTLTLESERGKGSTFTVTLPLTEVVDEALGELKTAGLADDSPDLVLAQGQDVLALVADDREENRDVLCRFLELAGFRTLQAVNGSDAIEKMRKHRPGVVLMDIRMPVMDGVKAVEIIRGDPDLKETVVITISASVFPESVQGFKDAGFDDFIGKPLTATELFEKLQKHLELRFVEVGAGESGETAPCKAETARETESLTAPQAAELAGKIRDALSVGDVSALEALGAELQAAGGGPAAYAAKITELAGSLDLAGLEALADEIEGSCADKG